MGSDVRYRVLDPYNDDISYTFDEKDEAKRYIEKSYPALRRSMAYVFRMEEVPTDRLITRKTLLNMMKVLKTDGYFIEPVNKGKLEESLADEDVDAFREFFSSRFRFFRDKDKDK
ncbi:MAG: hypothetical protein ACYCRD_01315 [Leptospirillum sp.]